MGWSCSKAAVDILRRMSDVCYNNSQSQNCWNEYKEGKTIRYMFEISRREYSDGAITGDILKLTLHEDGKDYCHKTGSLRINGDGSIARAPKFLKLAALVKTEEEIQDEKLINCGPCGGANGEHSCGIDD